jgi:hypothetical protein
MKKTALLLSVVLLLSATVGGCTSQSSDQIARELSNSMTDGMDFSGGSKVKGAPPQATTGSPLVTNFDAATTIYTGKTFQITLYTDYQTPADIKGAYVYVQKEAVGLDGGGKVVGADQYIVVTITQATEFYFTLTGMLADNQKLSGEKFVIKLGLFDAKGAGNYADWPVTVDSGKCADTGVCKSYCEKSSSCGSGETMDSCMSSCTPSAVKYLATLQTRIAVCGAVSDCEEAHSCFLNSFDYCPDTYDAKHSYCAKKKECDPTIDLDLCYATEGENPKWADTNCMCLSAIDNYKSCLTGVACSVFITYADRDCASLIPSSPRNSGN